MTRRKSSAPQLLMEPQQQRPNELVSQDSREEQLEQVISKSFESGNVIHDVINAEKIIPPIIVSAIPVELIGKIDLRRCTSPPHELSPYLNSNGIRMNLKLVPEPKGPDCETESPLGAKTIETIRLHGRKEAGATPGETDFYSRVSVAQADLAVSPFKPSVHSRTNQNGRSRKSSQGTRRFSLSQCRELMAKRTKYNVLLYLSATRILLTLIMTSFPMTCL